MSSIRVLQPLLWVLTASLSGLFIAAQPPAVSIVVLGLAAFLLLGAITPLAAFMALIVLAPMRTLIATEAAFQLPLDVGQVSVIGVLGSWTIYRIARRQPLLRFNLSPLHFPILLFILVLSLTAFNAASLGAWLSEWLKWIQVLLLTVLVLNLAQQKKWQWLVFGLGLSGTANALIGLYEFLGGSGAEHLLIENRFFRAFGTFGQPNPFGGFMGLLAPLSLMAALGYGLQWWDKRKKSKAQYYDLGMSLAYAAMSGLIVLGVVISWSRGAWLAFGVSMMALILAFPRKTWRGLLLITIVGCLMGLLWLSGRLPASITGRINSATEELFAFNDVRGIDITPENYAIVERLAHWQAALNMIYANPWLGIGAGNYEVVYPHYRLINWHFPLGHAHNYYLNIWAEAGIIGLAGYAALWLGILWFTWRARFHPDRVSRCIAVGLFGTWTYLAVHSLTDNLYVNNLFLHIGIMLGVLVVLYHQTWTNTKLRSQ